jgi:hypothetical protein
MGNILFGVPTPTVWLLSGIGLIGLSIFSRRFSIGNYRTPGRLLKIVLAAVTLLFFFYSTTFAISLLYALDARF